MDFLDTCSTYSVENNIYMVVTVCNCTRDEVLVVHTNGGFNTFTKIAPLNILPLDIHINEDSMADILSLKDVASIPGVHIMMYSSKERDINFEHGEKSLSLNSVVMGSIIMKLEQIIPINIKTQLITTSLGKRLSVINHTLPRKILKGQIDQGNYNKLFFEQGIPHSNTSSKNNSYATVISLYMTLAGRN